MRFVFRKQIANGKFSFLAALLVTLLGIGLKRLRTLHDDVTMRLIDFICYNFFFKYVNGLTVFIIDLDEFVIISTSTVLRR